MIISHKYKFIFIKTAKTAGTSIEVFLSPICADDDIFTPFSKSEPGHKPRNYQGFFNPFPEIISLIKNRAKYDDWNFSRLILKYLLSVINRRKFFHHIPAWQIRNRVSPDVWDNYFKFCVERNPYSKVISGWYWYNYKTKNNISLDEYLIFCQKRAKSIRYLRGVGIVPINYFNYTDPDTEKVIVDKIIDYENLINEFHEILKSLKIGRDLNELPNSKSGTRTRKDYRELINDSQKKKISDLFRKELEIYDYDF